MKKFLFLFYFIILSLLFFGCNNTNIQSYEYDSFSGTYTEVYPKNTTHEERIEIRSDIEYVSSTDTVVDYSKPLSPGQIFLVLIDPLGLVRPTFKEMKTVVYTSETPIRRKGFERPKTQIYNIGNEVVINNVYNR